MSIKEVEELITSAGRNLAVICELDWLTSGASHLLGQMTATPSLQPYMSSLALLQCYAFETCRSEEMLDWSTTARFVNHIWWLRDGYLSKLHSVVPKQTKDSLRFNTGPTHWQTSVCSPSQPPMQGRSKVF